MFSYTAPDQVAGKLLQVTKTHLYNINQQPQTASGSINVAYAYNSEGKLTNVTYPTTLDGNQNTNTPSFTYTYDQMMRLATMTESNTDSSLNHFVQPVVNSLRYNAANQMTGITYYQQTETRAYNSLMQLTNITTNAPGSQPVLNITCNYPTGSNNGKIASSSDAISGETVTYQYDSLNRLISASGATNGTTTWTQTQAYDGFGNLTGRTGTGSASGTTIRHPGERGDESALWLHLRQQRQPDLDRLHL
jgi:YD repeat-containing protein